MFQFIFAFVFYFFGDKNVLYHAILDISIFPLTDMIYYTPINSQATLIPNGLLNSLDISTIFPENTSECIFHSLMRYSRPPRN